MKRILAIVNFTSGTGAIRNRLPRLLELMSRNDALVTVYPIVPSKGLVSENVIDASCAQYDCILCCGGDGTLNYVINDVMNNHLSVPLAYIPSGSTNDFSKSLTGQRHADVDLALAAVNGDDFPYDIGLFNGRYFNYVAAFGAFTAVSYETPQDMKNSLGYFAYVLSTIGRLGNDLGYKVHMKVEHDGITEEGDYIYGSVSNSISVGGIESSFLSDVKLDDGLMEVSLIKYPETITDLNNIISDLTSGSITHDNIRLFKTDHIRFIADEETAWTLDGEAGGSHTECSISVVEKAITMKIPHRKGNE